MSKTTMGLLARAVVRYTAHNKRAAVAIENHTIDSQTVDDYNDLLKATIQERIRAKGEMI